MLRLFFAGVKADASFFFAGVKTDASFFLHRVKADDFLRSAGTAGFSNAEQEAGGTGFLYFV